MFGGTFTRHSGHKEVIGQFGGAVSLLTPRGASVFTATTSSDQHKPGKILVDEIIQTLQVN